jgi:hypothetical protein
VNRILPAFLLCLALRAAAQDIVVSEGDQTPKLKGFTTGKHVGMNAVFISKNFDATLSINRILTVQPKVDGKPFGRPVTMRVGISYSDGRHTIASKLVNIERQTAPQIQPSRVEFLGLHERKEKLSTRILFSDIGINFTGDVRDPAKLDRPSVIGYSVTFGPTHEISNDVPIEEMKKQTEGYTVKFFDPKRVGKVYGYWDFQKSQGNVAEAQVTGPWGPRRLSIEMPATRENGSIWGYFYNYRVARFFKGGWSFYRRGTDKVIPGPLILRVD